MRKTTIGLSIGIIIGLIDSIPMVLQKLSLDAIFSALAMWIAVGFLTSRIEMKINPIMKGILIAFLVLLPSAIIIGWKEPVSLIPIFVMTIVLGGLLGYSINRLMNAKESI